MKIGILGTRGIPNTYGGFEQFAQYLAEGLVEKGHAVFVYNSRTHSYKQPVWKDVQIIHCANPENKIGTAGQFIYDLNCLRDAGKRNFDILLQLGYTSSSVWHRYWPKNAVNIINMDGLEWKRAKYNKLTRRFLKWAESLAANYADVLIADSIGIRDHIQKEYQKNAFYIPYGAEIPENFSTSALSKFNLEANKYYLLIARMEPENNIETIIQGYKQSGQHYPLIIIGSTHNKYGHYLLKKYSSEFIQFPGAIYDQSIINALRYFSTLYFHGHSVGGTNPSLLEAMACGCNIAAHENVFNNAILGDDCYYFSDPEDVKKIISQPMEASIATHHKTLNLEKVKKTYNWTKIINDYETIFMQAALSKTNSITKKKM
jgi:glycosyltransferase involved in cell wall biosynthesis